MTHYMLKTMPVPTLTDCCCIKSLLCQDLVMQPKLFRLFKRYILTLRNCHLTRLANKLTRWFDETNASGKEFDYRFTDKESRLFLLNFMSLISVVESTAEPCREKPFSIFLPTFAFA